MCEAISVFIRYDLADENGKTRRDRNNAFNVVSPLLTIPDDGQYLWDWYHALSAGIRRVNDGVCFPVPWSEYLEWARVSNIEVYAAEFAILHAMDVAFCDEMNKELQAYRERITEQNKTNAPPSKRRRK